MLVYSNGRTFPRFVSEKQAVSLKICFWASECAFCLFIGCHSNSTDVLTFTENMFFSLCPSSCFISFFLGFFFAFCSLFSAVSVTLFVTLHLDLFGGGGDWINFERQCFCNWQQHGSPPLSMELLVPILNPQSYSAAAQAERIPFPHAPNKGHHPQKNETNKNVSVLLMSYRPSARKTQQSESFNITWHKKASK